VRKILLIVSLCLSIVTLLEAEERSVEVKPTGRELLETEPRKIVATAFRVTNKTSDKREFIPHVKLPEGWILITKDFPFDLDANESDTRLVSFFIPQATSAGKYMVTYSVRDRRYLSLSDSYTVYVVVLPVRKLEIISLEAPQYVVAGEDYRASFTIVNVSNVGVTVGLRVESGGNIPAVLDSERLHLATGESKKVMVIEKTDIEVRKPLKHRLKLTAKVIEDDKVKAEAINLVEIIPRISGVENRFHKIPIEMVFRSVTEKGEEVKSGFRTEISGSGTLDEEGKRHIAFLFRGQDIQDKSIFGERDEYSLSYWTKDYEFHFGDRSFSLSPLTELYRYGHGVEGKLNLNDFTLGAYHEKSRWIKPEQEKTATYVSYLFSKKYKLGLNYLKKKLTAGTGSSSRGPADGEVFSLRGQLEPTEKVDLDLEYGWGKTGRKEGREDDKAYRLRVFSHQDWISYHLRVIHAGPDYPGYYSDMDSKSGGLAVSLWGDLRFNANFRHDKNNLESDPTLLSAPLEQYHQLGLEYRFKDRTSLSFDYRNRGREDRLPKPHFNYRDETFGLRAGHSFEKLALYASSEWGKTRDKLADRSSALAKYGGNAYYRATSKQTYRGYFEHRINGDFTGEKRRSVTAGLNGSFQISNRTFFDLNFQTNNYQGSRYRDWDIFEVSSRHILPNENKISARARHTSYRISKERDETALMVEYTVPFRLAVSRRKSIGRITGYVYDEETKGAISNVVLRLNSATAVTDKNGNFTFPSLKPGTYYLIVDATAIGLNRITVKDTLMELTVEGGKETRVEVGITRAAALSGELLEMPSTINMLQVVPTRVSSSGTFTV